MLAMANKGGVVEATIPGLADMARISIEDCEAALFRFQQPDKYSWSKEREGRRLEEVEGGWFIINHDKYRNLLSKEDQAEKTRLRVARFRAKSVTAVTSNECNDIPAPDSSSSANTKPKIKVSPARRVPEDFIPTEAHYSLAKELGINCEMEFQKFRDYYLGLSGPKAVKRDWDATLRNWFRNSQNYRGGVSNDNHKTSAQLRNERSSAALERAFGETSATQDLPSPLFKRTH